MQFTYTGVSYPGSSFGLSNYVSGNASVVGGATYTYSADIRAANAAALGTFTINCATLHFESQSPYGFGDFFSTVGNVLSVGSWVHVQGQFVAPANAESAWIEVLGNDVQGAVFNVDNVQISGPRGPGRAIFYTPSPTSIAAGQSATLSWTSADATSATLNGQPVAACCPDNGYNPTINVTVQPTATTTYVLSSTGPQGTSSWTGAPVTITVLPLPAIASFAAIPNSISSGQSSTLSWATTDATSVSIDNGVGSQPLNGSVTVSPTQTTTYTLTASGPGGTRTAQATVSVAPAPTATLTSNTPSVVAGNPATLTWATANATQASIDNGIGVVATNGSIDVRPTSRTTYTLTATGPGGTATTQATVNVVPAVAAKLEASSSSIKTGESVNLWWSTTGASTATLSDGGTPAEVTLNSSGTTLTPSATTTYTLVATGAGGTSQSAVTVDVAPQPPTVEQFTATPTDIAPNGAVTLTWSTRNATHAYIDNGLGRVEASGSTTIPGINLPALKNTTTFTITAVNGNATATATTSVTVNGAPPPVIRQLSGSGAQGFLDGPASIAAFNKPSAIVASNVNSANGKVKQGDIFVLDSGNNAIRKIAPDGTTVTWAGGGPRGAQDGCGPAATFDFDHASGALSVNDDGSLLVRDRNGRRTVGSDQCVQSCPSCPAVLLPGGIARFGGHVFEADRGANVVLRDGSIVAGQYGKVGNTDAAPGTAGRLNGPTALTIDARGVVYVFDSGAGAIRRLVPPDYRVETVARSADARSGGGTLSMGSTGGSMAIIGPMIYLADPGSNTIKRITADGKITTVAGSGRAEASQLDAPLGVNSAADGTLLVADTSNHTIQTIDLAPKCSNATTLCLNNERYSVTVDVRGGDGKSIAAHALPQTDVFGYFSFPELTGDVNNPEVFVKVVGPVDGVPWIFYAGLTSLDYTIRVTDRTSVRTYHVDATAGSSKSSGNFDVNGSMSNQCDDIQPIVSQQTPGSCTPGSSMLCLLNNRFRISLSGRDQRSGKTAEGVTLPKTSGFGFFSLPGLTGDPSNIEVFVKMLDATSRNSGHWLFLGGLTDFEYTLVVTDTVTGKTKTYVKPAGSTCGINDVPAF